MHNNNKKESKYPHWKGFLVVVFIANECNTFLFPRMRIQLSKNEYCIIHLNIYINIW